MELTKEHRQALLHELDKAKQDLEQGRRSLKNSPSDIIAWVEIDAYLAQQRIVIIEKAITENEIDY